MEGESQQSRHMEVLSRLVIRGQYDNENHEPAPRGELEKLRREFRYVARMSDEEFAEFAALADTHHVIVRGSNVLQSVAALEPETKSPTRENDGRAAERCEIVLADEHARIDRAVGYLHSICGSLEARGCRVAVIKSLDHWPDLGSDLTSTRRRMSIRSSERCGRSSVPSVSSGVGAIGWPTSGTTVFRACRSWLKSMFNTWGRPASMRSSRAE